MTALPLLVPVLMVGLVLAVTLSGRVARGLAMPRWAALVLLAATALVVAVTLTPLRPPSGSGVDALLTEAEAGGYMTPPWQWRWLPPDDHLMNVLLFVPLGFAVMLVGRNAARRWLVAVAVMAPLLVEGTQLAVGWLGRSAQLKDVVDNLAGVLVGLAAGWIARSVRQRARASVSEPRGSFVR